MRSSMLRFFLKLTLWHLPLPWWLFGPTLDKVTVWGIKNSDYRVIDKRCAKLSVTLINYPAWKPPYTIRFLRQTNRTENFPGSTSGKEPVGQCRRYKWWWLWSLGWADFLEESTATHSSILAWRIPWTEEPGRLQSMWSQNQTGLKQLTTHTNTH